MGACVVTNLVHSIQGNLLCKLGTLTMSSSYATGGDTLTPAQMGLANVQILQLGEAPNSSNTANDLSLTNTATNTSSTIKVQAFGGEGNAPGGPYVEAANASNLSTYSCTFQALGF